MSFYGEQWLAHPYPLRQYPTINSPAHQDNFHEFVKRANAILCDVQHQENTTLPVVRTCAIYGLVVLWAAHCRFSVLFLSCYALLECCISQHSTDAVRIPYVVHVL